MNLKFFRETIRKNRQAFFALFTLIILAIGIGFGFIINHRDKSETKTERHESGYSYISPLIECYSEKSDSPGNYKLKEKLESAIDLYLESGKISSASVYFRDLANGPWIDINGDEKFTPASLLKVPIMITYYKLAENDPNILEGRVTASWKENENINQNIIPENQIESGQDYTIQELINYMIIESDNHAATILLNKLPYQSLNKTFDDLGLKFPDVDTPENYMSVKGYSSFFRVLYNASYLNKYYSEKSLEILSQSKYKDALVAGVPTEVEVAHKFGERRNMDLDQLHDCGIVYKTNKDYLLCIMTRGNNFNNLTEVIKNLSSLVYQNVN